MANKIRRKTQNFSKTKQLPNKGTKQKQQQKQNQTTKNLKKHENLGCVPMSAFLMQLAWPTFLAHQGG